MKKRDAVLSILDSNRPQEYTPAAFFMHFDPQFHKGQAAVNRHLEFFQYTGMDFVKIQYEQAPLPFTPVMEPEEWASVPHYPEVFFEDPVQLAEGLVKAVDGRVLVIMTLYSPFMWAGRFSGKERLDQHLREDPTAVARGLEIMTENVLSLVRGCIRAGVDGFYASTQGGESFRFKGTDIFEKYVKPTDLAVWEALRPCPFNILHICDYQGGYDDLTPFSDYPGQVVNSSLSLGERTMTPKEVSEMFKRPFMGGLDRKGVIAAGSHQEIRTEAQQILADAPSKFILAADCTVPSETPWSNLKTAVDLAHKHRPQDL
jgi:uroporphyrinogen decarboxylase